MPTGRRSTIAELELGMLPSATRRGREGHSAALAALCSTEAKEKKRSSLSPPMFSGRRSHSARPVVGTGIAVGSAIKRVGPAGIS